MKSVEEQIRENAQRQADKIALIAGEEQVTYQQLWERCLLAATNVRQKFNLQKGDRVILAAAANIDFIYAYFGIHLAGGVCVPIDPDTNETRFGHILTSTQPVCVMGTLHKVERETIPFSEVLTASDEILPFVQRRCV